MLNIRNTILSIVSIAPLLFALTCQAGAREEADRLAEQQAEIARRATPMDVEIGVPFDEAETKERMKSGNTTLSGVLYHQVNGAGEDDSSWIFSAPKTFLGGVEVVLYPATKYLTTYLEQARAYEKQQRDHNNTLQIKNFKVDENVRNYRLKTTTDSVGRYTFKNLSSGRYYVFTPKLEVNGDYIGTVTDGVDSYVDGYGNVYNNPRYRNANLKSRCQVEYVEFIDVPNKPVFDLESRARQVPGSLTNTARWESH